MSSRKMFAALLGVLALCGLLASSAGAATVTTTKDGGPGSLRQAIADAKAQETINLPAGTYRLSLGELPIHGKGLTIAGAGAGKTIVSGDKTSRVFEIQAGEGNTVNLTGITMRDGAVRTESNALGGAIRVFNGNLSLHDDVLTANAAQARQPEGLGGDVEGGALYFEGGRLLVADTRFVGNAAKSSQRVTGGAILAFGSELTIERSTIEGTVADARGDATFPDGGEVFGAGVWLDGFKLTQIVDSTISGNVADVTTGPAGFPGLAVGGGVLMPSNSAKSRVIGSTISGNVLRTGNGIATGGGLVVSGFDFGEELLPVDVNATTIAANSIEGADAASAGSNVATFEAGRIALADSIVADGVGAANCGESAPEGSIVSNGFNLDSEDKCGFQAAGDVVEADPQLGPLGGNGGPTATMLPAAGSPAIDQGKAPLGLIADQRGLTRTVDLAAIANSTAPDADGTDIGAVELQPAR